jgi:hypothetical protein
LLAALDATSCNETSYTLHPYVLFDNVAAYSIDQIPYLMDVFIQEQQHASVAYVLEKFVSK